MTNKSHWALTTLCAAATLTLFANSVAAEELAPQQLTTALQQGGLVIYLRHAATEKDYADQITADPAKCSTQRVLSEKGWKQAAIIGSSFSLLNIPVGAVYSSQYCRAWQTAKLVFGRYEKKNELNFEPAETYTREQIDAMKARVAPMLSTPPSAGTNTVMVGHDDPFEAATGIYPEPQGVAYVVRPKGGGFEVLGNIGPDEWPQLLAKLKPGQ